MIITDFLPVELSLGNITGEVQIAGNAPLTLQTPSFASATEIGAMRFQALSVVDLTIKDDTTFNLLDASGVFSLDLNVEYAACYIFCGARIYICARQGVTLTLNGAIALENCGYEETVLWL